MTATTQMFYNAGLFEQPNVYHFDTKFKWHKHTLIRLFESPYLKLKFIFALIKYRPDVIFVIMSPYWGFYDKISYCLIAKLFGVKSIFNSVSARFTKFYESNPFNKLLVKLLIRVPDCVVLGTPYWYRYFRQNFPHIKLCEIPNPVITEEFNSTPKLKSEKIRVVSAFRITKEKGIRELVAVIKSINERSDKFVFTILGDGNELSWVRTELAELIKEGKVELKGFLTGIEKNNAIINADAYIMLTHFDMMPIAILEAMAASLPIFSTNTGGIPDMVKNGLNGHLFEVGEVNAVVESLLNYENDKNKLIEYGRNSYKIVKNNYDIGVIIEMQFSLIESLFKTNAKRFLARQYLFSMNTLSLKIYNYLPQFLKEIAASQYAKQLQKFRRNSSSTKRITEATKRELWSFEEWEKYQNIELEKVLKRAFEHVPYYREYWKQKGCKNDEWKNLNNWPILTKEDIRQNNHLFLADDCDSKNMYSEYTSGTSGTPIKMYWSKETTLEYYAIYERRIKNWHDVNWDMNYIMLGGRVVTPIKQKSPPFWVKNSFMKQLYMSSYHLSENNVEAYVNAIKSFAPKYMLGYASSMYSLALLIKQKNISPPALICAISNAEPLLQYQKELIEEVFSCKMVNTYGMSELVTGACTFDNITEYVIWPEVGKVEIMEFESNKPVQNGLLGRIVCTSLLNKDMPLIRYDTGDIGSIEKSSTGIKHYKFNDLTGRIDDMVITKDGRRIGRLDPVFKKDFNIKEAQIIQHTFDNFIIKVVPSANFSERNKSELKQSLTERVGDCNVQIEVVDSIPRTNSGKFKAVISKLNKY